jgi:hypothetical protein
MERLMYTPTLTLPLLLRGREFEEKDEIPDKNFRE